MKKSKLVFAVKKAMKHFYKSGLTNVAYNVQSEILANIKKEYNKIHKRT